MCHAGAAVQEQAQAVGRYRRCEELGIGGFATVYRAHDPILDRDVALKVLHPHLARDAETRDRFVREGRALARIRHPNVVHIYDAGEAGGTAYLAMELVEGRSLAATLMARGPLPLDEVREIVRQVAAGLAAVHARGLVHRDVKPANIMLDEERNQPILLDLGLARPVEMSATSTSGWLVGTLGFMAPEQLDGEIGATPQTDVYQLGATAFTLLTGKAPFTGDPTRVIYAIAHQPAPDLAGARPDLPRAIAHVIDDALAKDPGRRPPDAPDFAARLEIAARGPVTSADAETVTVSVPPTRWRGPVIREPADPLGDVHAATTVHLSTPRPPYAVRRHAAHRARRGRSAALPVVLAVAVLLAGAAGGLAILLGRGDGTPESPALETPAVVFASAPPSPIEAAAPTTAATTPPTAAATDAPATAAAAAPAPAPTRTPAPAVPSAPPVLAARSPATAAPAQQPVTSAGDALAAAMGANGFTPVSRPVVIATSDGGALSAQVGSCGQECEQVFIAWNGRYLGTDAPEPSRSILGLAPAGPDAFSVTYANIPPSLPPMTITYTCGPSRCTPSPWPPPGHPNG